MPAKLRTAAAKRKSGKIFLAHWSGESQLATDTEDLLKTAIQDLEVTVLPRDAGPGFSYKNMQAGLSEARCLVLVLTRRTLRQSSWVAWELGMFLAHAERDRKCPVFPVCIGIREEDLQSTPISGLQAYYVDDLKSACNLVSKVGQATGRLAQPLDPAKYGEYQERVARELRRFGRAEHDVIEGVFAWMCADHNDRPGRKAGVRGQPVAATEELRDKTASAATEICHEAYWSSHVHEVIAKLVGDNFAPYVLLDFDPTDACDRYRLSVPIAHREHRDKLLFQKIAGDDKEARSYLIEDAQASQDPRNQRLGYWLLETEKFRDNAERTLGLFALLDEKEKRYDAISRKVFSFERGLDSSNHHHRLLVPAIVVPAAEKIDTEETQDLMQRLRWSGFGTDEALRHSLTALARSVRDRWYYGVGKKQIDGNPDEVRRATCGEVLFVPITREPRMTFEIFPNTLHGAEIPRDLSGLVLLRQCAERFHDALRLRLRKERLL